MAGHSKWAQIKRKKGAADAKRGQLFTKLARAITVAARDGGGDPEGNAALANAVEKAKSLRMPKENIERAIAKGTGAGGDAAAIEAVTYEGYGPGGVAILIECLTDNRNRTAAEVRHMFSRADASLGEPGSVAWMFEKKGVLLVDGGRYSEDDLMPAIDAGAEDLAAEGDSIRITCEAGDLRAVLRRARAPPGWRCSRPSSRWSRRPSWRWTPTTHASCCGCWTRSTSRTTSIRCTRTSTSVPT